LFTIIKKKLRFEALTLEFFVFRKKKFDFEKAT